MNGNPQDTCFRGAVAEKNEGHSVLRMLGNDVPKMPL
jgi:hypothetical protein